MKFKDIALGDIVYTIESVRFGTGQGKIFCIGREVTKVNTKTFQAGRFKFYKTTGFSSGVGKTIKCFKKGDSIGIGRTTIDESKEMDRYKAQAQERSTLKNRIRHMKISEELGLTSLKRIKKALDTIDNEINKQV